MSVHSFNCEGAHWTTNVNGIVCSGLETNKRQRTGDESWQTNHMKKYLSCVCIRQHNHGDLHGQSRDYFSRLHLIVDIDDCCARDRLKGRKCIYSVRARMCCTWEKLVGSERQKAAPFNKTCLAKRACIKHQTWVARMLISCPPQRDTEIRPLLCALTQGIKELHGHDVEYHYSYSIENC